MRADSGKGPGHKLLTSVSVLALALGGLVALLSARPDPVSAATTAISQCNADTFPTGAGFEVTCYVTVVNNTTAAGATSSTVTTIECLAAAGVPYPSCTKAPTLDGPVTTVVTSTNLVNSVTQCNSIVTGGGSNVICDVTIINNVPGGTSTSGVTVNQCNNLPTTIELCNPYPASTSGATVTQCNGSGGKGTYVGTYSVQCTVTGAASALPVTVNQCNGTATGGGSGVTCATTIINNFTSPPPPPTTTTTTAPGSTTTTAPGSTTTTAPGSTTTTAPGVVVKFSG